MTTDVHAPKSYTCPKCEKHHAADLSAMEGHPEIHGKVHCMGCHELLWLSLGEDGTTKCEVFEEHLHEVEEAQAAAEAPSSSDPKSAEPDAAPSDSAPSDSAPSASASTPTVADAGSTSPLLGSLIVAAAVAALVSFLMAPSDGGAAAPAEIDTPTAVANAAIEKRVGELEDALAVSRRAAGAARDELKQAQAVLHTAMQTHAADLKKAIALAAATRAAPQPDAADTTALEAIASRHKALQGRIEGYYNSLRIALKRIEALETK